MYRAIILIGYNVDTGYRDGLLEGVKDRLGPAWEVDAMTGAELLSDLRDCYICPSASIGRPEMRMCEAAIIGKRSIICLGNGDPWQATDVECVEAGDDEKGWRLIPKT